MAGRGVGAAVPDRGGAALPPGMGPGGGAGGAVVGSGLTGHDSWVKRVSSRIGNGVRKAVTGDPVRDSACSLRVMRRECLEAVPPYTGMHRFVPTLIKLAGFPVVEVPVHHRSSRFGRSKFGQTHPAMPAFVDLLVVRWMMRRRLRYRIVEQSLPPTPSEVVVIR